SAGCEHPASWSGAGQANRDERIATATADIERQPGTAGDANTATGLDALFNNTTGNLNPAFGETAGFNVTTASNVICIGAGVQGENVNNTCYIGNIFGVTSVGGATVFVNADGKVGTTTSSRRFKDGIKPMQSASEALFSLRPVTFCYKKEIEPAGTSQFGL